jgi:hypothetical protein
MEDSASPRRLHVRSQLRRIPTHRQNSPRLFLIGLRSDNARGISLLALSPYNHSSLLASDLYAAARLTLSALLKAEPPLRLSYSSFAARNRRFFDLSDGLILKTKYKNLTEELCSNKNAEQGIFWNGPKQNPWRFRFTAASPD